MRAAAPLLGPRSNVFREGAIIGRVEETGGGFVAKTIDGAAIGVFATEQEAILAIQDRARRDLPAGARK